jgi:2-amino-4-hydroxy-6-hydroxymethyldihydropteridine diphosphokinase
VATVYLGLGSNQDPAGHFEAAIAALSERFGTIALSTIYASAAVGFEGPSFWNAVARIDTDLDIEALDRWLHALEDARGRRRDVPRFSSRPLDIDILLYDDLVWKGPGNLAVPRADVTELAFVLRPLAELAPALRHPVNRQTMAELWADFGPAPDLIALPNPDWHPEHP